MPSIDKLIMLIETGIDDSTSQLLTSRKIPKVRQRLLRMKDAHLYFQPSTVSLGPYHHGKQEYQMMQTFKEREVARYLKSKKAPVKEIYSEIRSMIKEVRDHYEKHPTDKFNDKELTFMMFLDGAFLLTFWEVLDTMPIGQDLLVLENQIPLWVLNVIVDSTTHIRKDNIRVDSIINDYFSNSIYLFGPRYGSFIISYK